MTLKYAVGAISERSVNKAFRELVHWSWIIK